MDTHLSISEIVDRLDIPQIWVALSLPGKSGRCVRSPFREDSNPSFSVYQQGGRWRYRDHGTGDHGDALDFIAQALGVSKGEALSWSKAFLGCAAQSPREGQARDDHNNATVKKPLPKLRSGTPAELQQLADQRGIGIKGLRLASTRGVFGFTSFAGSTCWAVRDRRGQMMELRRLDGRPFDAYKHLPERKSHCVGSGKSYPLGIEEAIEAGVEKIAMVEGAPDFLAAFSFLEVEGKVNSVAPIAMLGAANHRIAPDALEQLRGKMVALYPHCDVPGQTASRDWALQLRDAGAKVIAFNLSGCTKSDGSSGKDLADVCQISPDCYEDDEKWSSVLP